MKCLAGVLCAVSLMGAPVKPLPGDIVPFQGMFLKWDGTRWLDRAAQAKAESGFDPNAQSWIVNKQGHRVPCAFGLLQFTMPTWKTWGDAGASPLDPEPSIKANGRYMKWLEAKWDESWDLGNASYNAGLGSIQKAVRLSESLGIPGENGWMQALPRVTGAANAKQTTDYVARIRKYRDDFRKKAGQ